MNVRDLIQELESLDPEMSVFLSKDEEGNEFNLLFEVVVHDDDDLGEQVVLWP